MPPASTCDPGVAVQLNPLNGKEVVLFGEKENGPEMELPGSRVSVIVICQPEPASKTESGIDTVPAAEGDGESEKSVIATVYELLPSDTFAVIDA